MYDAGTSRSEPSLLDSIVRTFEAGQRVVLDRIELAYFDLKQLATKTLHGAVLIAIGAVLLCGAWFALVVGAVAWLQQYLTLPASVLIVAGLTAVAGGASLALGIRRAQRGAAEHISDLVEDVREGAPNPPQPTRAAEQ
jgi:Putative Actinobacterial Holin-X, holin superfamily III